MTNKKQRSFIILFIAVIITSSLLRSTIVTVGPISELIISDLNVSATSFGLITSVPLAVFAISSLIIPYIASRSGLINTLIVGHILIIIGSILRSVDSYAILMIGTILLGFGISMGNVLLPSIIKEYSQKHSGVLTGVYLSMQNFMASIASGVAFFIATAVSWSFLMLLWALPAAIAIVFWFVYKRSISSTSKTTQGTINILTWSDIKALITSPYAWSVSLIMALQSVMYYTNVAWLPTIATNLGFSQEYISLLMISFQLIPLPGLFLIPLLFKKMKIDSYILLFCSSLTIIGITILILSTTPIPFFIGTLSISFGTGASFAWVVAVITNKSRDSKQASTLSAMSQTIGYTLAAVGPLLGGLLVDYTGVPRTILFFVLAACCTITLTSIYIYFKRNTLSFK